MTTPGEEQALQAARTARRLYIDGIECITGRLQSDGSYARQKEAGQPDKIWVTETDSRTERLVWKNGKVNDAYAGVAVICKYSQSEGFYIHSLANEKVAISHPGAADSMGAPRRAAELSAEVIAGRNYRGTGRLSVFTPGTLLINFEEPYPYTDTDGNRQVWVPTEANSLDITSAIPPDDSGSAQFNWLQFAFNPDATTPGLVAFEGTPKLAGLYLPAVDDTAYVDIAVTAGYYVLDALKVRTGDTTVDELRWVYARQGGSSGSGSIAVTDGTTTVDPAALLDFDPGFFEVSNMGSDTAGVTLIADASVIAYTPADATKWPEGVPTTLAEAFDILAARVGGDVEPSDALELPETGLLYWFYAGDGVYQPATIISDGDGQPVSEWHDQSPWAYHVTESGSVRPSYDLSSAAFGGRGAVTFSGAQKLSRTVASSILAEATLYNFFIVFASSSSGASQWMVAEGNTGSNPPNWGATKTVSGIELSTRANSNTGVSIASGDIGSNDGVPILLTIRRTAAGSWSVRVNGIEIGTSATSLGATTINRFAIGALVRASTLNYFTGQIACIVAYNSDNHATIEPLLAEHYGITL